MRCTVQNNLLNCRKILYCFFLAFFYCFSGECLPQFGSVTSGAHNGGAKFSQKLLAEITEGAIAMAGDQIRHHDGEDGTHGR